MKVQYQIFLAILFSVSAMADNDPIELVAIGEVIDSFHDAAAHGDNERYLKQLTDDAVFIGTDEWERWPKQPDFIDYVGSRFKDGKGWEYRSVERTISISDSADVAWFDEVIDSESNGHFRGTGVLTRQNGHWKIAHYAMSFLIFNENWDDVIQLSKTTRGKKDDTAALE